MQVGEIAQLRRYLPGQLVAVEVQPCQVGEVAQVRRYLPGQLVVVLPNQQIKDPFVLEFLDLKDEYSESDLEEALIQHLETFLLELGDDFCFMGRQRRLRVGSQWYRVDLCIDPEYARTYAGQVAAVTAASLFGRMTESVAVDVPSLGMLPSLPWEASTGILVAPPTG